MQKPFASSAPAICVHSHENEVFDHYERLLGESTTAEPFEEEATTRSSGVRRMFPLILLAICGAAFALAQVDVKEGLLTGRSVAHAIGR